MCSSRPAWRILSLKSARQTGERALTGTKKLAREGSHVLVEEADTAVADAHRSRGEAFDIFALQEVVLKLPYPDCLRVW
jgi:hypothetical protein